MKSFEGACKELFLLGMTDTFLELIKLTDQEREKRAREILEKYPVGGTGYYNCGQIAAAAESLNKTKFVVSSYSIFEYYTRGLPTAV